MIRLMTEVGAEIARANNLAAADVIHSVTRTADGTVQIHTGRVTVNRDQTTGRVAPAATFYLTPHEVKALIEELSR